MNDKYLKIYALEVEKRIEMLLYAFASEFEDDSDLLVHSLSGETDFFEIMNRIYQLKAGAEEAVIGIKSREVDLKARRERLERKSDALKGMMLSLMKTAQQSKVELFEATLSVRKGSTSVEIVDANDLPSQLCRLVFQPDKKAIKEHIEAGEDVPGARLVVGDDGLTIKRT